MRIGRWAVLMASALALVACDPNANGTWNARTGSSGSSDSSGGGFSGSVRISFPANGATNVPTAVDIQYAARSGATVTVKDSTGNTVAGARVDGSGGSASARWVPAKQLKYDTKYTATVSAGGRTSTVKFTTMAKPANLVHTSSQVGDNWVVGVGMPMILQFSVEVPKDQRDDVQKRLFMSSDPPQQGAWNWISGKEVHFRPKEYWQPGTKLSLRAALGGLSFGGKWYGERDMTVDATVGRKLIMEIDNATKRMTVTRDGVTLKALPVSLGKAGSPSDSGNLLVMAKNDWEWFDSSTYGVPVNSPDGYRTKVSFPMRLTWGGQYIHAAPWSLQDQGLRNVSHGCVNISLDLARWLYGMTHVGDPVIVKGTEERVKAGDGWTDWELPWAQYIRGSALPV